MLLDSSVFVHALALCESDRIGPRTRVWAFAHVGKGAVVGADCNLCDHVYVEGGAVIGDRVTVKNNVAIWDGVTVEDDVFLGPGAVLTNDLVPRAAFMKTPRELRPTLIARGATVGANATIVCGLTIGRGAFVGAGSVVLSDVPDHALVVGNPAQRIGWICSCGTRMGCDLICSECAARYVEAGTGLRPIIA
jgi:acetyltransferase-like isoleucine patch superfamily enzyme